MKNTRIIIAITGILLPYLARLPLGSAWVSQYTDISFVGILFFGVFNAIAWGSILAISFLFHRPSSLIFPCVFGFAFLAWAHYTLDLSADAQSAISLVIIPIYALLPITFGGVLGFVLDRYLGRQDKAAEQGRSRATGE